MKRFRCKACSNELYFASAACLRCGSHVGYQPLAFVMLTIVRDQAGEWVGRDANGSYGLCRNAAHNACNWLVPKGKDDGFCLSCRHNRTVPDLSLPANLEGWQALELAKRYMIYSLMRWRLSVPTKAENTAAGLAFDILSDDTAPDGSLVRVLTGHKDGLITLNISEAHDATREQIRTDLREPYRTLLGHFRHEIGHYFWDRLVRDGCKLEAFRTVFGDDRADYAAALARHYEQGPAPDWAQRYISSYASVHPWEDFAETWAHYTHIVDSLETARSYGMTITAAPAGKPEAEVDFSPYEAPDVETIMDVWVPFTLALNSINRSMGQRDFYPFVISVPVLAKLDFVHRLVHGRDNGKSASNG